MNESYRQHFTNPKAAVLYDAEQYADGGYSQLLWELEQPVLSVIIRRMQARKPDLQALDFAAGTGRITQLLETHCTAVTAIEISEQMAARARQGLRHARVICADITPPSVPVEGTYDLITAFRFVLNAEPALRLAAFRALALRLRDGNSRLVFNNHGNLWSTKLFAWPYHRLKNLGGGWRPYGNYLGHDSIDDLCRQAGLRIVGRHGQGLLGGRLAARFPSAVARAIEESFATCGMARFFGQNIIYVARKEGA